MFDGGYHCSSDSARGLRCASPEAEKPKPKPSPLVEGPLGT